MKKQDITVSSPLLPDLKDFVPYLEDIWKSKWLTNNGEYHERLEKALCEYLGVEHLNLFSNGTLALIVALQALKISGEVITTPYSFVATTHSLWWNNIKPVFVDIEPETFNIDPDRIEAAITPATTAIMPVHVYGNPCRVDKIQTIADTYGLRVIYDAAHAFGVCRDGVSVLNYGDLSILSFHATKVYSTIEGGAIICHDRKMKHRIDFLKNFGFAGETTVVAPGINAKLNEVQAAFGLLSLKVVDEAIARRKEMAAAYREGLENVHGIHFLPEVEGLQQNYGYFPILVDDAKYGMRRDELYELMKSHQIMGRRYFYPLISDFPTYRGLPSATRENLPVATRVASQVICLPMHHNLTEEDVKEIVQIIKNKS
ncbi:MAG: DegT/DnrJ/EryC1/StrS family aminotransferase [Bacteroidales bacterium]|jgi:dTDP-4-amino-4,6-dideoxygalactose transaminase|nr:DegT/DnrJ/EryC1/StrS family aminotransferase [Bacteroidales bacterium]